MIILVTSSFAPSSPALSMAPSAVGPTMDCRRTFVAELAPSDRESLCSIGRNNAMENGPHRIPGICKPAIHAVFAWEKSGGEGFWL
jgi:hypothetical protein